MQNYIRAQNEEYGPNNNYLTGRHFPNANESNPAGPYQRSDNPMPPTGETDVVGAMGVGAMGGAMLGGLGGPVTGAAGIPLGAIAGLLQQYLTRGPQSPHARYVGAYNDEYGPQASADSAGFDEYLAQMLSAQQGAQR